MKQPKNACLPCIVSGMILCAALLLFAYAATKPGLNQTSIQPEMAEPSHDKKPAGQSDDSDAGCSASGRCLPRYGGGTIIDFVRPWR